MRIWLDRLKNFLRRPRWSSIVFWLRRLGPQERFFSYHVIQEEPLIVVLADYETSFEFLREIRHREADIFLQCSWTLESPDKLAVMRRFHAWSESCPHHRIVRLANSPAEKAILDRAGLPGILCNHNCFLDERIFNLQPEQPKRFRAIYDARLTPFKRHELAVQVEGLALVTYVTEADHDDAYVRRTVQELSAATWLNGPHTERRALIQSAEIAQAINQSRTGLILSAAEGTNFACVQYLLCGVPVVTTRSVGGREVFFHPDYVVTVEADPHAVASGVEELIRRQLNPQLIRQRTLAIMAAHRQAFLTEVQRVLAARQPGVEPKIEWSQIFVHKMLESHPRRAVRALAQAR